MSIQKQILTLAFVALMAEGAVAQAVGNPQRGKAEAQRLCSDCHAIDAGSTSSPVPKALPFYTVANTKGVTPLALSVWLQTSHPTMPNLILKPDTMNDIIAYIRSLRRAPE